jgi:hypothetical protein
MLLSTAPHLLCLQLFEGFFRCQTFTAFKLTEGSLDLVVDGGPVLAQPVFVHLKRFECAVNRLFRRGEGSTFEALPNELHILGPDPGCHWSYRLPRIGRRPTQSRLQNRTKFLRYAKLGGATNKAYKS